MLQIKILKNSIQTHGAKFQTQAEADVWLANGIANNWWGKPERWIRADQLDQQNEDINQALESREVDNGLETYTEYKFVAEYTIQTVDLSQDYDYLLQECHKNRLSEYPSLGDFADAYVKMQNGDSTQMAAYTAKCNEVKTKYPKPVQS